MDSALYRAVDSFSPNLRPIVPPLRAAVRSAQAAESGREEEDPAVVLERWESDWKAFLHGKTLTISDRGESWRSGARKGQLWGTRKQPDRHYRYFYCDLSDAVSQGWVLDTAHHASRLLSLPQELRFMIYEYAFPCAVPVAAAAAATEEPSRSTKRRLRPKKEIPSDLDPRFSHLTGINIIFTCKQLYLECRPFAVRAYVCPEDRLPPYYGLQPSIRDYTSLGLGVLGYLMTAPALNIFNIILSDAL
jgi:hypothetical protein